MANPTLNFASIGLSSAKVYTTSSNVANEFLRVRADFVNGQNTATVVNDIAGYLGSGSIEAGMYLRSPNEFNTPTKITNYNSGTKVITLDGTSVASETNQLTFITLPAGWVYVATASFSKVGGGTYNPPNDFRDVTGSEDTEFQAGDLPWGIIGQLEATASAGIGLAGKYAQYTITRVTNRENAATISFYATASDTVPAFKEPTGYSLTYNQPYLLLSEISGSFMTVAGANDLSGGGQGLGLASYQNVVASTISVLTSGSSFPYTGSAEITGSLGVTGSSEFLINSSENFIIKNASSPTQSLFNINQDGVAVFRAREGVDGVPTAIVGGLYFTTSSAYIGVN
jgi:hypothetical protein